MIHLKIQETACPAGPHTALRAKKETEEHPMKVLVINCGSSSLKYQLLDMETEQVVCKGLCERIGGEGSCITHQVGGNKNKVESPFPTHTEAFAKLVEMMTSGDGKVIDSIDEIDAIGHRGVHGGEKIQKSCLVTDEVIKTIEELVPLAPLHNPACLLGDARLLSTRHRSTSELLRTL